MADPMLSRLVSRLTFANVCSCVALVVALGTGGAYAGGTISSHDIKNKSIRSVDIKDGQVKAVDIADGGVGSADIADGSLGSQDLGAGSVDGLRIVDASVTTADLAGADVNGEKISIPTGAVADGRCKQYSSAVQGATAGEAVVYSVQGALQNGVVIYGQRVASDGEVTIDVCNFSGTTLAAIVDLPVRVITFG